MDTVSAECAGIARMKVRDVSDMESGLPSVHAWYNDNSDGRS